MAADFDHEDKYSWYFGPLSRDDAEGILRPERDSGVFLVRESMTMRGDLVLCVKEDNKISHYIINKITSADDTVNFRIGDQEFPDLKTLLSFYKTHYLDTTSLIRPAPRKKIIGKYNFPGRDPEDLPFQRNEVLEIISKDEDDWWTARNDQGRVGSIPVNYITDYEGHNGLTASSHEVAPSPPRFQTIPTMHHMRADRLPAKAIVMQQRIPNAYDRTQLRLDVGDIVTVTQMNVNGQWEGEINGKKGIFPFTHIRFVEENSD